MDLEHALQITLEIASRDASWDIYDCDGPTNDHRARWARPAWAAHRQARHNATPTPADVPLDHEIADAICDLLHLADTIDDGDPLAVLISALGSYAAESAHPVHCADCRHAAELDAVAIASVIGTRVQLASGHFGTVNDVRIDEHHGDEWSVVTSGTTEVVWQRAEDCHVVEDGRA